jgi:hypothetical protein
MRRVAFLTTTLLVGDNDRISTLCRKVISLGGLASSFSNASSYRSFQMTSPTRDQIEKPGGSICKATA